MSVVRTTIERIDPKLETDATRDQEQKSIVSEKKMKIVLYWNPYFQLFYPRDKVARSSCQYTDCLVTLNRSYLSSADLVVFNPFRTELNDLPDFRPPGQIWIAREWEPPRPMTKWNLFSSMIDATATYRTDSDIYIPYGKYEELAEGDKNNYDPERNYAKDHSKLVAWMVSHCGTRNRRDDYAKELSKHLPLDIYGKCGQEKCKNKKHCLRVLAQYKFYLAFENTFCYQYITEKVWRTLQYADSFVIPIVLGGVDYRNLLPPHSYVDVRQFSSPAALAEYLTYLDKNDTAYNEYFKWRRRFKIVTVHEDCQMCAFANRKGRFNLTRRDQYLWWAEGSCTSAHQFYRGVADMLTYAPAQTGPNIDNERALPRI